MDVVNETRVIIKLEEHIEAPFITDGATETLADIRTALRDVTVRRVDNHAISQFQVEITQSLKLLCRQSFPLALIREAGKSDGTGEKRVSSEHTPRNVRAIRVRE